MWVSRDRINWIVLGGGWYVNNENRSIFSGNSDNIKMNETHMQVSEGYKITTQHSKLTSRVINISGLIIADTAEQARDRRNEISRLVIGDNVYFYDEPEGKVFSGYVPNINVTNNRGKYAGRTILLNFNVTMLYPFYEQMDRTVLNFNDVGKVEFNLDSEYTEYTMKVTPRYYPTYFTSIFDGLIEFTEQISIENSGDYIYISTENAQSVIDKVSSSGNRDSILGKVKDIFHTDMYTLTKGENSFILGSGLKDSSNIELSFYRRFL